MNIAVVLVVIAPVLPAPVYAIRHLEVDNSHSFTIESIPADNRYYKHRKKSNYIVSNNIYMLIISILTNFNSRAILGSLADTFHPISYSLWGRLQDAMAFPN